MPYKSKPGARKYGDSPLNANKNGGYSPYKMKGHTLPGIKQSPAKWMGALANVGSLSMSPKERMKHAKRRSFSMMIKGPF